MKLLRAPSHNEVVGRIKLPKCLRLTTTRPLRRLLLKTCHSHLESFQTALSTTRTLGMVGWGSQSSSSNIAARGENRTRHYLHLTYVHSPTRTLQPPRLPKLNTNTPFRILSPGSILTLDHRACFSLRLVQTSFQPRHQCQVLKW